MLLILHFLNRTITQVSNDVKKGEWMRISVLIKEANAISVGLHKVCPVTCRISTTLT